MPSDPIESETESSPGAWVGDLAWPEVARRIDSGAIAVLPIGAGAKEHGRHLPLATDRMQAEWFADRLTKHDNVLIWPTLTYGHYPAFAEFPGSLSVSAELFSALVVELIGQLGAHGVRRVLLLNTGISTIPPLQAAMAQAPSPTQVRLANLYAGPKRRQVVQQIGEQAAGSHADELETSVMLALAPCHVDMSQASSWASLSMMGGRFQRLDAAHPNYAPDGIWGDARLATRAKGEALVAAMLEDLLATLRNPWAV